MPFCIKCKTKNSSIDYFKFPDDKEVKKKWVDFLKSNHLRLRENSTLCGKHFTDNCFLTDADKRILKPDSVPSIEVVKKPKGRKNEGSKKSSKKCILCGNNSADLSYFTVPKDEETKQKWEKFCEFELGNGNYSLCHLHFKPSAIRIENGKRKLQLNALPTIFFDDYQFEFIPVDRKTNNEDNSNDVESIVIEPNVFPTTKTNRNASEDSIISIDYSEFNTPPRTPTFNTSMSSENTARNSTAEDIVNIFIPNYEDSNENSGNTPTNNETVSKSIQTTNGTTVSVYGLNGRKKRLSYPGDFKAEEIDSLEVAKFAITNLRTVLDKKNKTVSVLSKKVKRLENKNAALKETIRQLRVEKAAKEAREKEDLFEVKGWWDS